MEQVQGQGMYIGGNRSFVYIVGHRIVKSILQHTEMVIKGQEQHEGLCSFLLWCGSLCPGGSGKKFFFLNFPWHVFLGAKEGQ